MVDAVTSVQAANGNDTVPVLIFGDFGFVDVAKRWLTTYPETAKATIFVAFDSPAALTVAAAGFRVIEYV
jgi:hypothetical protein